MKLQLFGYILEIRKAPLTNSQRTAKLYNERKEKGLCMRCSKPVKEVSAYKGREGRPYLKCKEHREEEAQQAWIRNNFK